MEKFKVSILTTDAESPAKNQLTLDWQEATQENMNVAAEKIKEIAPVIEGLSDNDTVTASIEIADSENESNAIVAVNNVSKAKGLQFFQKIKTAIQALNPQTVSAAPAEPAKETPVETPTEQVSAPEGDEHQP